jgi:hypothetical protein
LDNGGVNITNFIDTWDDSTNAVKGYIAIDSNTSADTSYGIFRLNSITTATGYRKLNVTYLSGTGPSNNEKIVIRFFRAGDQGIQGIQGYTGSQGIQGIQGVIGYTGSRGATGTQGIIGFTGSQGYNTQTLATPPSTPNNGDMWFDTESGTIKVYYNDGDTSQWVTAAGTQGSIGYTGSRGATGATGAQGPIGYTGSSASLAFNDLINKTSGTGDYTTTGTFNGATFNATSVTNGGFQGIDADTAAIPSFTWTADLNTGMWHAGSDQIGFTTGGTNRLTISTTGLISTLNITAPAFTGALTGNASTATALQTARTINGVSFNGTANITIADTTKIPLSGGTATGTISAPTFNATSTTNGGFQGIDADTAALPSFTWTSDLNTGIWHPAADQVGITCGGTNAATITTTAATFVGDVVAYSDERLKFEVSTISDALAKVTGLRGVSYIKDGKPSIGVIAQEVEKIIPEVVHDGEYKSVAYGNLVGLLIEAIKELSNEIDILKGKK